MGDDPTLMLNAPGPAARKVVARAGLTLDDIDLFEVNEAFAVVVEKFIRDLEIDREKINVNAGAMALGQPNGATSTEERRVRKEWYTTCRSRRFPVNYNKQTKLRNPIQHTI